MKRGWVIALALCAAVAVAIWLAGGRSVDRASESSAPVRLGGVARDAEPATRPRDAGNGMPGLGGRRGSAGSNVDAGSGARDSVRPLSQGGGVAPQHGRVPLDTTTREGARRERAVGALPERRLDAVREADDLPLDAAPDADSAAAAEEAADEPADIPEIAFDGGPDRAFDTASQVEVAELGPIDGPAGTVSFWIEPQWERRDAASANFVQLGDSGLEIGKDRDMLRVRYTDATGNVYGGTASIAQWGPGDWRHVVATWNNGDMALFIDGHQQFLNGAPAPPNVGGTPTLYVGSALPGGAPAAPGTLSSLTIMNRTASAAEIRQMFESGGAPGQR